MTTKPPALIVAVEPDAEQAKQLVAMAKRYLRAEFIVEGTAAAALKALRERVPDLILTPVLLSSRDETLLLEHQRRLGAAAAHVQTLGIPILSSSVPTMRERGSRLIGRRQRPEPEQGGCELSVFADQVKIYLERAAAEQQARTDALRDTPLPPQSAMAAENEATGLALEPTAPTFAGEPAVTSVAEHLTAPIDEPPVAVESPQMPPQLAVLEEETYEEWLPVDLPPPDLSKTLALEAELGLGAVPGHAPQLWKVAMDQSTPANPSPVAATPMRRRPRAHKPPPPPDDWAYFDPTQSGFKALIRRLDEVSAQFLANA